MKKLEILNKIPTIKLPSIMSSDAQVILRLVTILAATHLANKVDKVIKDFEALDNPDDIIHIFR
jgi:hypothetical protein